MRTVCHGTSKFLYQAALAVALTVLPVSATSVPQLSFPELVDQSDAVVTGVVSRSWSDWDSTHQVIWTHTEIQVEQAHKGAANSRTVVVSEPGGEVAGQGMLVAGSVHYEPNQRVVVFLKNYPAIGYRTHGWGQGKYLVDAKGKLQADSSLKALDITDVKKGAGEAASVKLNGLSLSAIHGLVQARVGTGAKN